MVEFAIVILIHRRTTLKAIPNKTLDMIKGGDALELQDPRWKSRFNNSGKNKLEGSEKTGLIIFPTHTIDFLAFL